MTPVSLHRLVLVFDSEFGDLAFNPIIQDVVLHRLVKSSHLQCGISRCVMSSCWQTNQSTPSQADPAKTESKMDSSSCIRTYMLHYKDCLFSRNGQKRHTVKVQHCIGQSVVLNRFTP